MLLRFRRRPLVLNNSILARPRVQDDRLLRIRRNNIDLICDAGPCHTELWLRAYHSKYNIYGCTLGTPYSPRRFVTALHLRLRFPTNAVWCDRNNDWTADRGRNRFSCRRATNYRETFKQQQRTRQIDFSKNVHILTFEVPTFVRRSRTFLMRYRFAIRRNPWVTCLKPRPD